MTPEQAAAFVIAQAVCAAAEIAGMQAENHQAASVGTMRYTGADFYAVQEKFCISHNAVLGIFNGARR